MRLTRIMYHVSKIKFREEIFSLKTGLPPKFPIAFGLLHAIADNQPNPRIKAPWSATVQISVSDKNDPLKPKLGAVREFSIDLSHPSLVEDAGRFCRSGEKYAHLLKWGTVKKCLFPSPLRFEDGRRACIPCGY
jgi:hypothetical protein